MTTIPKERLVSRRSGPYCLARSITMLTASASASGANAASKIVKTTTIRPSTTGGHGAPNPTITTAPPIAATWSARTRPSVTSARWPQIGTTIVKPTAEIAAIRPMAAGSKPRAWSITVTNG